MLPHTIEYHIADVGNAWGIFREGMQIAVRDDPADAIAFANYFADRETLMSPHPVRVSADTNLHRALRAMRTAA
jgi:predicted transcriptional regulator